MKLVIQVAPADDAKAWAMLQRHSPGVALPNRTFVVSEEAAQALRQAGIRFLVLSNEIQTLNEEGVTAGERI
jgi:rhodanese-related sulfurtransferase